MPINNPVAFIGEVVLDATVGAPLSTDPNGQLISGISNQSISSTTTITTTSSSDVLMTSMTLTPVAGTYFVIFDTSVQTTTGGNSITISIYSGGVEITNSSRTVQFPTATLIDSGYPFHTGSQAQGVVVNGSQAITVEWHTSGGTATCLNRTLSIIRTA